MSRLIVFGCSHTFGHGLPDCIRENGLSGYYPSQYSWPSVLAKKLNLELYNSAISGGSNFAILDLIVNFKFNPDDTVIVLWSYFERDMIFNKDGTRNHFRFNDNKFRLIKKRPIDYWLEIHTATDVRMRAWYYIHYAFLFLNCTVNNFYFLHVNHEYEFMNIRPNFTKIVTFLPVHFSDYLENYPKAEDKVHGGVECHLKFAMALEAEITKPKFL